MLECLARQCTAFVLGQVFAGDKAFGYPAVVGGVNDDDDVREVLGCAANHGGPANVDVLQRVYEGGVGTAHGVNEWVEVGGDDIDCADTVRGELRVVLGDVAAGEYAAVDGGVQGLHAAVENLWEAGDVFDVLRGDAGGRYGGVRAACADERVAAVVKSAGEVGEVGLVVHAEERLHGCVLLI